MTTVRAYGWRKDPPSDRDHHAAVLLSAKPAPPAAASLIDRWGGRIYQSINDCTAHAAADSIRTALTPPGGPAVPLPSRAWLYYQAGVPTGDQHNDVGRYNRDVCKALAHLGWPDESIVPYGTWPKHPGASAYRAAFDRRAQTGIAYHRITDATGTSRRYEMMQAIAHGYPFFFGTLVTPAFEYQDGKTPLPMPSMNDTILGGHSISAVAYDEHGVRFANWWGGFGDENGMGYLSWDWMTSSYVSDAWAFEIRPGATT